MFPTYTQLQQLLKDRQASAQRSSAYAQAATLAALVNGTRRVPRRSR